MLGLRKAEAIIIVKSMCGKPSWSLNVKLEPRMVNRISLSRANGNSYVLIGRLAVTCPYYYHCPEFT